MKGDPLPYSMPGVAEGHVIGWRVWKIANNGTLRSLMTECVWPPGAPVSSRSGWLPPNTISLTFPWSNLDGGKPGIFAFKDQGRAEELCEEQAVRVTDGLCHFIAGSVALWGEIAEHRKGWRAEYAYPVSFIRVPDAGPAFSVVVQAAELYDCTLEEPALSTEERDGIRARCERKVTVVPGGLTLVPQRMTATQVAFQQQQMMALLQAQQAALQQQAASVFLQQPGQMIPLPQALAPAPRGLFSWLFGGGR